MAGYFRQDRWLIPTEDWYPNFPDGRVRASLMQLLPCSLNRYRVAVWGADDFGLERDFDTREEAQRVFDGLPLVIEQGHLRSIGFQPR